MQTVPFLGFSRFRPSHAWASEEHTQTHILYDLVLCYPLPFSSINTIYFILQFEPERMSIPIVARILIKVWGEYW